MGSPPPDDSPSPSADAEASAGIEFPATPDATICGFAISLPRFKLGISVFLDGLIPIPVFPLPWFAFALSCDPSAPIDVSGGLPFGGGRPVNNEPDPDLMEEAA